MAGAKYKRWTRKCKEETCGKEFTTKFHQQLYCDSCRDIRSKEYMLKGVRRIIACEECGKEFKPHHHAVKYCPKHREKYKKKDSYEGNYSAYLTNDGDYLREFWNDVVRNKLKDGKKKVHSPLVQRMKASEYLRDDISGRPARAEPKKPKEEEEGPPPMKFVTAEEVIDKPEDNSGEEKSI